ncbi:MAG: site-specific integrase [Pyrinomonadaceae bacterium]
MFKEFLKRKWIDEVPGIEIVNAAEVERDRVMSFEEETLLLNNCVEVETIEKVRNGKRYKTTIEAKRAHLKPLIITLVDTAMRLNEVLTLTWENIDIEKRTISVPFYNSKTERSRKTPITKRVMKELSQLASETELVFKSGNPSRAFRTACKRAGINDLNIHDLRHTAITRMIRAGIPHTEVMKISGHTTMKTFMRYLNLLDETIQENANQLDDFVHRNQLK